MNRNFFLSTGVSRPSERWQRAFPDGECRRHEELIALAHGGDVIWVSAAAPGWEGALKLLRQELPQCAVVVATLAPQDAEALFALEAGARGYCPLLAVPGLLQEVATAVAHGGLWIGPELMGRVVGALGKVLSAAAEPEDNLSAREAEVARAVAEGLSNKEVALRLDITERTVKAHLGSIFEKLGVRDRLQLVLRLSARHAVERA